MCSTSLHPFCHICSIFVHIGITDWFLWWPNLPSDRFWSHHCHQKRSLIFGMEHFYELGFLKNQVSSSPTKILIWSISGEHRIATPPPLDEPVLLATCRRFGSATFNRLFCWTSCHGWWIILNNHKPVAMISCKKWSLTSGCLSIEMSGANEMITQRFVVTFLRLQAVKKTSETSKKLHILSQVFQWYVVHNGIPE